MTDEIRKVSKKKIIFVQIDEEITGIFERVQKLSYKDIYLVVPKRAVLLQSIVNLKILKQKLEEIDKTLAIITNDPNGMKLACQAEVRVFDHWNIDESAKLQKQERDPETALLKPIAATQNDVSEDSPFRLPKKKSSIFEVVRHLKGKGKGFSLRAYLSDFRKHRLEKQTLNFYLTPGRKKFLAGFLLFSAIIFFVIVYVVLPGATIYIEPSSYVITKVINVSFTQNPSEPRELASYAVDANTELTITHPATGITSNGQNASGNLTVINTSGTERPLIASTRFQTDDGIVFRLQKEVIVPAGSTDNPGKLELTVVADPVDANGLATGDRGNVGPSKFFLPGLREDSRSELYGESYTAMTGGTTDVIVKVTEEDLIAAQTKLASDLEEKALSALRKEALSLGNTKGLSLKLLEDSDVLQFGTAKIDLPYELIGKEMGTFELSGTISASGVAYDPDALYEILKNEIIASKTPGKQLVSINGDSISLNVLESNNSSLTYKVTVQIQGVEEYEINPQSVGGAELAEKIKEHIAGKTVIEATNYIENLPDVNKVQIKLWPIWSPSIPSLPDNIRIKSLSESEQIE
ncbi:MAG: hypothetical protein WC897_00560 [Candidatus Gracilibacteria bacterium]